MSPWSWRVPAYRAPASTRTPSSAGVDIPATILALAGSKKSRFHDGQSFAAGLTNEQFAGRRPFLYMDAIREEPFHGRPGWAVRDADYKLIEYDDGVRQLFDMRTDIAEANDLIANGVPANLQSEVDALEAAGHEFRGAAW